MKQDSEQLNSEEDIDLMDIMPKIMAKYPESVLREMLSKKFEKDLVRIRKRREDVYADNDALRAKGVSFVERQKVLNRERLKFCDEHEAKLLHDMRVFKVRPLYQWFTVEDYWDAKRNGFEWVLGMRFEDAYYVPNN